MENNIRSVEKKILPETENPMRFEINNLYWVNQIISKRFCFHFFKRENTEELTSIFSA